MSLHQTITAAVLLTCLTAALAFSGAFSKTTTAQDLATLLKENPKVVVGAVESNRAAIFDLMNKAALERQDQDRKKIAAAETQALEAAYKNPLKPMLSDSSLTRGRPDAKYTLVMYGDFQCPYCRQALATVATLRKAHGDNLRVVYKHMPLSFHSEAERVAQWVEAATLQSKEKAWQFHDIAYESQDKLSLRFLRDTARKLRIDVAKCEKDADGKIVRDRISADIKEAQKFGLEGTPGFLLNGIPVKGAFPVEHFEAIIDRLDRTSSAKAPQGGQETTALR